MDHSEIRSGRHMATKPSTAGKERLSEGPPKARPRSGGSGYRVRTRGDLPADLLDKVSQAQAQAILLLRDVASG